MDSQFRVPLTSIRFGLDPLLGLLPLVGDTATALVGVAMILEARRLRLPRDVLWRMAGNLALDWAAGLLPGIDLVTDTLIRAHTKNAELMTEALRRREIDRG